MCRQICLDIQFRDATTIRQYLFGILYLENDKTSIFGLDNGKTSIFGSDKISCLVVKSVFVLPQRAFILLRNTVITRKLDKHFLM